MQGYKQTSVIKAFQKFDYQIVRQSKHTILEKNSHHIAIPHSNVINPLIIRRLVRECSIDLKAFLKLLR